MFARSKASEFDVSQVQSVWAWFQGLLIIFQSGWMIVSYFEYNNHQQDPSCALPPAKKTHMSDSSNLEVLSLFFTMLFYYLINEAHHLNFSLPSMYVSLTFLNMAQAQHVVIFNPLFIYFLTFASQEKKSLVLLTISYFLCKI
jgi:hypothetical protein